MSFDQPVVRPVLVPDPVAAVASSSFTRPPAVAESSALDLTLRALRPILTDREVTEICINRPGEAYIETVSYTHLTLPTNREV